MSDLPNFTVPPMVDFPSAPASSALGLGLDLPLRAPHPHETIAMNESSSPITAALGALVQADNSPELLVVVGAPQGNHSHTQEDVPPADRLLSRQSPERDLDNYLRRFIEEIGEGVRFDPALPAEAAIVQLKGRLDILKALTDARTHIRNSLRETLASLHSNPDPEA